MLALPGGVVGVVEEGVSAGLGAFLSSGAGLTGAGVIGAGITGDGVTGGLSVVRMAGSGLVRLASMGSQPTKASSEAAINAETAIEVVVGMTVISKSGVAYMIRKPTWEYARHMPNGEQHGVPRVNERNDILTAFRQLVRSLKSCGKLMESVGRPSTRGTQNACQFAARP